MSEVASRPAASRDRGSGRGSRGGFAGRGARRTNGDKSDHKPADDALAALDEEGDFVELRKQYGDKTSVIREMFPDWSEADVLFALQETNGDQNEAVARIAEGTISQWGEVSKPKKTARAKAAKDPNHAPATSDPPVSNPRNARAGRAASEGGRGRARGSDRGGVRGGRGRTAHAGVNGSRNKENQQLSVPTEESSAWDNEKPVWDGGEPKAAVAAKPTAAHDAPQVAAPPAKTWASMLRQSTAPKPAPAPKESSAPKPAEIPPLQPTAEPVPPEPEVTESMEETTPIAQNAVPVPVPAIAEPAATLAPPRARLTETNLERVVDASNPPATDTAASTAADSWDPRQSPVSASATPLSAAQHQHQVQRTTVSGFAASAMKATAERSARAPNHQRRVLDQEEAVRMPGNREVDRAAVQFGALNLYGGDEDIDGEREEPETRAQPPADSPVAHPRASLPPVSQPVAVPEAYPQKPGAAITASAPISATTAPATHPQAPSAQQYGRFGHGGAQDAAATPHKPADPFSHQSTSAAQPPFDNYSAQSSQSQAQQPSVAYTSAPSEYSNYYTAGQPERNLYNFYGQQYGAQQGAHGQHEGGVPSQQRPFGGYNAQSDNLSQYPQSGAMHAQPRFGASSESQNSGHSTPNPTAQGQQQQQAQQPQAQQPQQQGAPGTQPQSHGQQYPSYNHPYYSNPYYHQYYSGYGQGGFGPYGGKGGMYSQPYGVSPNAPYEQHASSPGAFRPLSLHRDSGLGSGLGDYGRAAASGQAGSQPGLGGASFGASHEGFGRSSFQSQGQSFNSQGQPPASGSSDELKSYGEAKGGSGPSPSLAGEPRPGSAANNAPGHGGLPPPQTSQYGGYPSHLQGHGLHGGSGYGMGVGAAASQHANTPYGSYGQDFGSGGYYGGGGQQQRGGWGGNYH